jgi:hypothetical protein
LGNGTFAITFLKSFCFNKLIAMGSGEKKQKSMVVKQQRSALVWGLGLVLGVLVLYGTAVPVALAASLAVSPSQAKVAVGKTFAVSVTVASTTQSVNAVAASLTFPPELLEAVSVSKSGSIVSVWVQEPAFSNSIGTVTAEGIILNPGYTGSGAKLVTITFKARASGVATIGFASGSVLANDGLGTNVLTSSGNSRVTIGDGSAAPAPAETPAVVAGLPAKPVIISATHPDPEKWYVSKNPTFSWQLPRGVDAVNFVADRKADTNPGTSSDGLRSSFTYQNVAEGTWYFHLRFHNNTGWGDTTHFRFQIDTIKPDALEIESLQDADPTASTGKFILTGSDTGSGLDHYELSIDGNEAIVVAATGRTTTYESAVLGVGSHTLAVKALDKAGNALSKTISFTTQAEGKKAVRAFAIAFSINPEKLRELLPAALLLLYALLSLWLFVMWQKYRGLKHGIHGKVREAQTGLHQVFRLIKDDIQSQIKLLEKTKTKRELTLEEKKIIKRLAKDLKDMERFVGDEIGDINHL